MQYFNTEYICTLIFQVSGVIGVRIIDVVMLYIILQTHAVKK